MNIRFEAFFSPTITPLDEKERVDELGFINQLNRLMDNGIHGIYLLGTSGEFTTLTIRSASGRWISPSKQSAVVCLLSVV